MDAAFAIELILRYGYVLVFVAATLEALPLVGMLVPGQAVVILAAFMAAQGVFEVWPLLLGAFIAGIIGDGVGYIAGRRYGRGLLVRFGPRFRVGETQIARADALFAKYGPLALVAARFSFLTRGLGPLLAGITRMPRLTFWSLNVVGAALWAGVYVGIGYVSGETLRVIEGVVGRYLAFGFLFAGGVYVLYRVLRKANPLFTREDAWLAGVAALAIIAFARLAQHVIDPDTPGFLIDESRAEIAAALAPAMPLWRTLDIVGDSIVLGPFVIVLFVALAWRRKWWDAALFAMAVGGNEVIVSVLKVAFARPRPEDALLVIESYAFPSGHVSATVVLLGAAIYVLGRKASHPATMWAAVAAGIAVTILMALSRIAVGDHYPTDVAGGFLVGVAWLCIVLLVIEYAVKRTPGARPLPGQDERDELVA